MRGAGAVVSLLLALAPLSGCHRPPAEAFVRGTSIDRPTAQTTLGANAAGETCVQQPSGARGAEVFCGTWQQPSARVEFGGAGGAAEMASVATTGPWRTAIDSRMQCDGPTATSILGGHPALLLSCTSRSGGWPQVAMVASVAGSIWRGDAVLPAATAMERSIGDLSGVAPAGT